MRLTMGTLALSFVALLAAAPGCGGDDDGATPGDDAGQRVDSGGADATTSSGGGSSSGNGTDDGGSSSGGQSQLPTTCEGDCQTTSASITLGQDSDVFTHAYFGYLLDGTLHVETYIGGERKCPEKESPTPNQNLIVSTAIPTDTQTIERGPTLGMGLLDFEGRFVDIPSPPMTVGRITPIAGLFARAKGDFIAYQVHAELEGGLLIDGHVYATYCEDMNERSSN